jgi:hypothetical protein
VARATPRRHRAVSTPALDSESSHVPALVGLAVALGILLLAFSTALNIYARIAWWGKFVHGADAFIAAFLIALLLLGYRDAQAVDISDELTGLLAIFAGIAFGVVWETIEFIVDWVADSNLQNGNFDTMTDFLANDLATVIAVLVAVRLYCRALDTANRRALGRLSIWLVGGPSRLLNRHGVLMTIAFAAVIALAIGVLWFAGRPVPGLPSS